MPPGAYENQISIIRSVLEIHLKTIFILKCHIIINLLGLIRNHPISLFQKKYLNILVELDDTCLY